MTDDTTPGDLLGSVREVQATLRERYDASQVEIEGRDNTTWTPAPGGAEMVDRAEPLQLTLTWAKSDIPAGDPERSPILQGLDHAMEVLEDIAEEFPTGEVSAHVEHNRVDIHLTFGGWP